MNNPKLKIALPILLSLSMIAGIFIGFKMRDGFPGKAFFSMEQKSSINEVFNLIQNKYVDEVSLNKLADTAIDVILSKLDPHSIRIPAAQLESINEDLQGSFYGIGIEFDIFSDTLNVTHVLNNGPAFKSGIQFGDKFINANGKVIAGKKLSADSLRKIICGNKGTALKMEVLRNGSLITVNIKRDYVPINSIDASYMITPEIGYIKINKFSTQTYHEFMTALMGLKNKGLKKLILDLRGNGGGVLDEAVDIADEFLEGDKLITYTIGKHFPKKEYRCRRLGQFEKGTLIVLTDEGSASASEVLMGALQDWDRATILGRRSFGKGLVQEQFDLSDHSALRLTIARYYTPIGRSIQRSYKNGEYAYYEEIYNRIGNNNPARQDSIAYEATEKFKTPSGKILYGGGGISPDYFMPSDNEMLNETMAGLLTKNIIDRFAYNYLIHNEQMKNRYSSALDFDLSFQFNESDWQAFISLAQKDSIDTKKITSTNKSSIQQSLKARISRFFWDKNGLYEILNANDAVIKKALELIK